MNEEQEHEFNFEMARRLRERTREQQEQHIEQFVRAFSDAVEPFKNRSRTGGIVSLQSNGADNASRLCNVV